MGEEKKGTKSKMGENVRGMEREIERGKERELGEGTGAKERGMKGDKKERRRERGRQRN